MSNEITTAVRAKYGAVAESELSDNHAGVRAVACPTDYLMLPSEDLQLTDYLWSVDSLGLSTWAVKERVGYLWIWLRGKTK